MTCCRSQITWWCVRIKISCFAAIRNYFKGLYLTIKSWLRYTYRGLPIVLTVYTWHNLSRDCWETTFQYFVHQTNMNILMAVLGEIEIGLLICTSKLANCYLIRYLYLVVSWIFFPSLKQPLETKILSTSSMMFLCVIITEL